MNPTVVFHENPARTPEERFWIYKRLAAIWAAEVAWNPKLPSEFYLEPQPPDYKRVDLRASVRTIIDYPSLLLRTE